MMNPPTRPTRPRTRAAIPSPFLLPLAVCIPIPGGIGAEGVGAEGVGAAGVGAGGMDAAGVGTAGVDPGGIDPGGGVAGV